MEGGNNGGSDGSGNGSNGSGHNHPHGGRPRGHHNYYRGRWTRPFIYVNPTDINRESGQNQAINALQSRIAQYERAANTSTQAFNFANPNTKMGLGAAAAVVIVLLLILVLKPKMDK